MNTTITNTLRILDLVGSGIDRDKLDDIDPALVPFGIKQGLVRVVLPATNGNPIRVHLTGLALEQSLVLRDAGHPLLGIDITRHGLTIRQDLSQEQWLATLQRLRLVKEAYHNALADLISHGRSLFGDSFVNESIEQLQFPFDDINHAASIATVPRRLREAFALTSEHYYILGTKFAEDHPSQELWAERAREHQLTPLALKRSIEAGMILTDELLSQRTGRGSGIPVLHGIALPFTRWLGHIGGIQTVEQWSADQRAEVLRELTPIVEFALTLRDTLPDDDS